MTGETKRTASFRLARAQTRLAGDLSGSAGFALLGEASDEFDCAVVDVGVAAGDSEPGAVAALLGVEREVV